VTPATRKSASTAETGEALLSAYLDKITQGDCLDHLPNLPADSIHLCLTDIPYGINLAEWDVLHPNTNSALLGQSPAQVGKSGFKRRGKPINGWSAADRQIPQAYQAWCSRWTPLLFPIMKEGASVFLFGARRTLHRAIVAFEDSGFLLRDILAWEKPVAHHRAQSLPNLLRNRGLDAEAARWEGWKVGNLAPRWEPIAWFFKPYRHTILDNVLAHEVGGLHTEACRVDGASPTNVLRFEPEPGERLHEAQKPLALLRYLITLTTREGQIVLDPFMGSGTTAVAARDLGRHFLGFEIDPAFCRIAEARLNSMEKS
jgi:site-specific DNA-methyltransferase (adenine-specific)